MGIRTLFLAACFPTLTVADYEHYRDGPREPCHDDCEFEFLTGCLRVHKNYAQCREELDRGDGPLGSGRIHEDDPDTGEVGRGWIYGCKKWCIDTPKMAGYAVKHTLETLGECVRKPGRLDGEAGGEDLECSERCEMEFFKCIRPQEDGGSLLPNQCAQLLWRADQPFTSTCEHCCKMTEAMLKTLPKKNRVAKKRRAPLSPPPPPPSPARSWAAMSEAGEEDERCAVRMDARAVDPNELEDAVRMASSSDPLARPLLITHAFDWPALKSWKDKENFVARHGFREVAVFTSSATITTQGLAVQAAKGRKGPSDKVPAADVPPWTLEKLVRELEEDPTKRGKTEGTPFALDGVSPSVVVGMAADLGSFHHLGSAGLDDYLPRERRTLRVMGNGSGLLLHKEPRSYHAQIVGGTKWTLLPPQALFKLVGTDGLYQHVIFRQPASWPPSDKKRLAGEDNNRLLECTQRPGDLMIIPARWWRATTNIGDSIAVGAEDLSLAGMEEAWADCAFWGHSFAENEHLDSKRLNGRFKTLQAEPLHVKYLHGFIYEMTHRSEVSPNSTRIALTMIPRILSHLDRLYETNYLQAPDYLAILQRHAELFEPPALQAWPAVWAKPVPYPPFQIPFGISVTGELWKPGNKAYDALVEGSFEDDEVLGADESKPPHPEEDRYQEFYQSKIFHTFPQQRPVITEPSDDAKQEWIQASDEIAVLKSLIVAKASALQAKDGNAAGAIPLYSTGPQPHLTGNLGSKSLDPQQPGLSA